MVMDDMKSQARIRFPCLEVMLCSQSSLLRGLAIVFLQRLAKAMITTPNYRSWRRTGCRGLKSLDNHAALAAPEPWAKDIRTFDDESELLTLGLHDAAFLQYSCCTQCKSVGKSFTGLQTVHWLGNLGCQRDREETALARRVPRQSIGRLSFCRMR